MAVNDLWTTETIEETTLKSRRDWGEKENITVEQLSDGRWSVDLRGYSFNGPSLEQILLDLAFIMNGYLKLNATREDSLRVTREWTNRTMEAIEKQQRAYEEKVTIGGIF